MKYAWIEAHEGFYGVGELCRALMVSPSGYRAWKRGGTPSRQRLTEAQLITLIRSIHAEYKGAYGSPRVIRELRDRGFPVSKGRVERLMGTSKNPCHLGRSGKIEGLPSLPEQSR